MSVSKTKGGRRYFVKTKCGKIIELQSYLTNPIDVWTRTVRSMRAKGYKYANSYSVSRTGKGEQE